MRCRFTQKMNKQFFFFNFFTLPAKKPKFVHSFFGRIYGTQISLRFYLTFSGFKRVVNLSFQKSNISCWILAHFLLLILLSLRAIYFISSQYETPCISGSSRNDIITSISLIQTCLTASIACCIVIFLFMIK